MTESAVHHVPVYQRNTTQLLLLKVIQHSQRLLSLLVGRWYATITIGGLNMTIDLAFKGLDSTGALKAFGMKVQLLVLALHLLPLVLLRLTAAPMILEGLIKNDQANRQRAALRKQERQAHKFKADQLKAAYQAS